MDSISDQIVFSFSNLRSTVDDPLDIIQCLLYVDATFSIEINKRRFFYEPNFLIVEFSEYALRWSRNTIDDFYYVSMEAEETPLIGFLTHKPGCLVPYSPWQDFDCTTCVDEDGLKSASIALAKCLRDSARSELNLDINGVLGDIME